MTLKLRLSPGRQKSKGKGRDKLVVFEVRQEGQWGWWDWGEGGRRRGQKGRQGPWEETGFWCYDKYSHWKSLNKLMTSSVLILKGLPGDWTENRL